MAKKSLGVAGIVLEWPVARMLPATGKRVLCEKLLAPSVADATVDGRSGRTTPPGSPLSARDIGFDMSRRDQIELVGTDGHITVTDP